MTISKLLVEVKFSDKLPEVFPEDGESDENYQGVEKQKELKEMREEFADEVKKAVLKSVKDVLEKDGVEQYFFDYNADEVSIEGWETLEDYGVSIKVKEIKSQEVRKHEH